MKYTLSLLILFNFSSFFLFSQEWTLPFTSRIEKSGKKLQGATVTLMQGGKQVMQTMTGEDGSFKFQIPSNGDYTVIVTKTGHCTKKFQVSTRGVPPDKTQDNFRGFNIESISLFEPLPGIDYSVLNQALVKVTYDPIKDNFDYDEAYSNQMLEALDKLRQLELAAQNKQKELEANYVAAIKTGDKAFQKKDWAAAKAAYNQALTFKPTELYPKEQLAQIEIIIKDQEALNKKNNSDKAAADKAAADKLAQDKADKAIADKALADKTLADKAAADKLAKDKIDKEFADKTNANKALADKAASDKAASDKLVMEKADKVLADKLAKDEAAKKAADDKAVVDKAISDKTAADKIAREKVEKELADKLSKDELAKKAAADKILSDITVTEKAAADKAAAARLVKEKADKELADKLSKDELARKATVDKIAADKAEVARLIKEKVDKEIVDKLTKNEAAKKAAADKSLADIAAVEKADSEEAEIARLAKEKAEKELLEKLSKVDEGKKAAADKIEAAKLAKELLDKDKIITPPVLTVDKYKQAKEKADAFFNSKKYQESKISYEEALIAKAGDSYAKGRLAEIEKLLKSDTAIAATIDTKKRALLSKYSPGVTEETIVGTGVVIVQRVVVKDSSVYVYQKKIFSWGGISFFRDTKAVTESIFEQETKP